jgi:hypothetical protein
VKGEDNEGMIGDVIGPTLTNKSVQMRRTLGAMVKYVREAMALLLAFNFPNIEGSEDNHPHRINDRDCYAKLPAQSRLFVDGCPSRIEPDETSESTRMTQRLFDRVLVSVK